MFASSKTQIKTNHKTPHFNQYNGYSRMICGNNFNLKLSKNYQYFPVNNQKIVSDLVKLSKSEHMYPKIHKIYT